MKAIDLIRSHEGLRLIGYTDSDGSLTIGYGQHADSLTPDQRAWLTAARGSVANAFSQGITFDEANRLLAERVAALEAWASVAISDFSCLSETRQAVLIDMAYELGEGRPGMSGLLGFTNFIKAIESGNYARAVIEMGQSHWAKQVPARENNDALLFGAG